MQFRILVLLMLFPFFIFSQPPYHSGEKRPVDPLSIGDILPALSFTNITNTTGQKIELAVKGKPSLIVFFATWCSTCLHEASELITYHKAKNDSLQIIMVTYENLQQVQAAQQKNKTWAALPFPIIYGDTILRKYFPYRVVPHNIWIGKDNEVLAITHTGEVNEHNLALLIHHQKLSFSLKKDILDFEPAKPLLFNGNGGSPGLLQKRSSFISYMPGMSSSSGSQTNQSLKRYYWINQPILALYAYTLKDPGIRIELTVTDTSRYYIPQSLTEKWKTLNLFSYELELPAAAPLNEVKKIMQQDIDNHFKTYSNLQKRKIKCLVLKLSNGKKHALRSVSGKTMFSVDAENKIITLQNQPLSRLVKAFNYHYAASAPPPLLIDETNFNHPVDLQLTATLHDVSKLKTELKRYGLKIVSRKRYVHVLMINELNPKP